MSENSPISSNNGFVLTQKVLRNSSLLGSARLVAATIGDRYDQVKGYSKVSIDYIVDNAGLSRSTVIRSIADMVKSGEWIAQKGIGMPTRYYPVMSKLDTIQPREKTTSERGKTARDSIQNDKPESDSSDSHNLLTAVDDSDIEAARPTNKGAKTASVSRQKKGNNSNDGYEPLPSTMVETTLVSTVPTEYPYTDEDTDPCLNGLPLTDYIPHSDHIPVVVNPPVLETSLAMAIRLHKRTDINTRFVKHDFTVPKIKEIIDLLNHQGYPLEAIDIALWIQCRDFQPLNPRFISVALSKCVKDGEIVFYDAEDGEKPNPAHTLANEIYVVYYCRKVMDNPDLLAYEDDEEEPVEQESKYVESL